MRVIPILNMIDCQLFKTKNFKNPQYVGDPINVIRIFNNKFVDEIIILDIRASKTEQEPNFDLIEKITGECFMPLTYGGGIKNLQHATKLFHLGVDKVSLQSGYFLDHILAKEIALKYGNQAVSLSIDIRKKFSGKYLINESIKVSNIKEVIEFIKKLNISYIGELLVTSVNNEGTLSGPDLNLIRELIDWTNIPVVYNGGISSIDDIHNVEEIGLTAVAAGSFFIYSGPHRAVLISYPKLSDFDRKQGKK